MNLGTFAEWWWVGAGIAGLAAWRVYLTKKRETDNNKKIIAKQLRQAQINEDNLSEKYDELEKRYHQALIDLRRTNEELSQTKQIVGNLFTEVEPLARRIIDTKPATIRSAVPYLSVSPGNISECIAWCRRTCTPDGVDVRYIAPRS